MTVGARTGATWSSTSASPAACRRCRRPSRTLSLNSLCTDPVTRRHALRLRNTGATAAQGPLGGHRLRAERRPARPGQAGHVLRRPGRQTRSITSSSPRARRRSSGDDRHTKCGGSDHRQQGRHGRGHRRLGPWRDRRQGRQRVLEDRRARRRSAGDRQGPGALPARVGRRSASSPAAVRYAISEPDPLGAVASVDPALVTVLDGQSHMVMVTNALPRPRSPPEPPEPPVPPQPPLPPGPPQPPPGPDLVLAASLGGGADLAISERISPRVSQVGGVVSVTIRVRNHGPQPAVDAARARDPAGRPAPPQPDRADPRREGRPSARPRGCTSTRPVRCGGGDAAPSAPRRSSACRARMLSRGASRAWSWRRSQHARHQHGQQRRRLRPRRPAPGQRRGRRPRAAASAGVGEPVSYRVVARGTGSDGAASVRFCHRPPARLLVTSAPGTFRYRGRVCRDVSRLRARAARGVHRARHPGRERRRAHAARCSRRPRRPTPGRRRGRDRIAVVAQTFAGTG